MNVASIGVIPAVNQLPPRATLRGKKRKSRSRLKGEVEARNARECDLNALEM